MNDDAISWREEPLRDDDIFLTLINEDEVDRIFTDTAIQNDDSLIVVPPQELMIELPPILLTEIQEQDTQPILIDEDEIDEIFLREAIRHDKGKAPKRRPSQSDSRGVAKRRRTETGPRINNNDAFIECNYCQRRMKIGAFLNHMRKFHKEFFDLNSKRVFKPSDYGKIIEYIKCPYCGVEIQKRLLQNHLENICISTRKELPIRELPLSPSTSTSRNSNNNRATFNYHCPFCSERFKELYILKKHFRTHSGDVNKNVIGYKTDATFRHSGINSYQCEKCGKYLKADLIFQHNKFFHENYKCSRCGNKSNNFDQYKYHLMLRTCRYDPNSNKSYYECLKCGKILSARNIYEAASHYLSHLPNPKRCPVQGCDYDPKDDAIGTNKSRALQKHVRQNHDAKEYEKILKKILYVNNKA